MEEEKPTFKQLYKKYFKSKTAEGFLTIRPWLEAKKLQLEIGEVSEGTLKMVSIAWPDAIEVAAYLRAVISGHAETLYPADPQNNVNTPESFISYGGGDSANGVVARVVKVHHWNNTDGKAFAWKCGVFEGRRSATGAVMPELNKPISQNMIKISRQEMSVISYRVDLALYGYAATVGDEFWITPN